jgi:hypothetical protein
MLQGVACKIVDGYLSVLVAALPQSRPGIG